ncbi:MAG: glycosyltransferase family 39 protein [Phycisphaerae bacterium]|jgi:hypothetical protein
MTNPPPADASRPRRSLRIAGVWPAVVLWAVLMAPLLRWGLPSRAQDDLLFGGEPAWTPERFGAAAAIEQRRERQAGADTDLNPLARRDAIAPLTADEGARGEILRRYRLFTRQPDEMITMMALQRMQPRQFDFDPKLYQYGGGYIYLVAAALAGSSAVGVTQLTGDVNVYLTQPELFARFYIVARVLTLVFGGLLLVAVWKLARRAAGRTAAWLAFIFVACTPVFITGVLEAKPHLPSACLALWATLSALNYWTYGRPRDAVHMGWQAGYAFGLVLTGIVALALWPALLLARRRNRNEPGGRVRLADLVLGLSLAGGVYLITNPYIPYNFLFNQTTLSSNFGNSLAMYADQMQRIALGAWRVGVLLVESCGPMALVAGAIGFVWLLRRWPRPVIVASAAGLMMLVIAVLLGADKPAEYARFLLLPVSLLCVAAAILAAQLGHRRRWLALAVAVVVVLPMGTAAYVRSFIADAGGRTESREQAGRYLRDHLAPGQTVGVLQEPAPYAVPPLDFASLDVFWLPPNAPVEPSAVALPDWLAFTADDADVFRGAWWTDAYELVARYPDERHALSRIAWADKPTFLYRCTVPSSQPGE